MMMKMYMYSIHEFDTIEDAERFIEGQVGTFQIEAIYISN
jgi:hypothetical protein